MKSERVNESRSGRSVGRWGGNAADPCVGGGTVNWTSASHRKLIVAPHRELGTREAIACLIDGGEKYSNTQTRNKAADLL